MNFFGGVGDSHCFLLNSSLQLYVIKAPTQIEVKNAVSQITFLLFKSEISIFFFYVFILKNIFPYLENFSALIDFIVN